MTTIQLAQQIARRTAAKTLTALAVEDLNALATAINAALKDWFQKATMPHVTTPIGADLRGSLTINGTATNGSKTIVLSNAPSWFTTDGIGSSVQVAGDARWNRLMSATELLFPYNGPTGAVEFKVWHDVVPLPDTLLQVGSPVRLIRSAGVFNERILTNAIVPPVWTFEGHVHWSGDPMYYGIEPINTAAHSTPFFVLRVWPMPTRAVTLAFPIVNVYQITLAALSSPVTLPLPEDVCSTIILPLALDYAAGADLLKKDTDFKRIAFDAQNARAAIALRTMHVVTEPQAMGTVPGW